jgi:multidrug efflux pump subunit AcrB
MAKNFQFRERQNIIRIFIILIVIIPFGITSFVTISIVAAPNVTAPILQFSTDLPF